MIGILPELKMARRLSATHHARWMGSCLYILKMLICGDKFFMGAQQRADLLMFAYYIIYIHFNYWFSCTKMADAPAITLSLYRDLEAWQVRDPKGGKVALKKLELHLDYLSGRSVILGMASDRVDDATKRAMADALSEVMEQATPVAAGCKPRLPQMGPNKTLADFVDEESVVFFQVH